MDGCWAEICQDQAQLSLHIEAYLVIQVCIKSSTNETCLPIPLKIVLDSNADLQLFHYYSGWWLLRICGVGCAGYVVLVAHFCGVGCAGYVVGAGENKIKANSAHLR